MIHRKTVVKNIFLIFFLLLFFLQEGGYTFAQTNIYYVKPGGSGNFSGASWENAFASVQQAVDSASNQNPKADVWVAAGTYIGDGVNHNNAFTIEEGVDVYGSFAGIEPSDYDLTARDFIGNAAILDGQNVQRVLCQENVFTTRTVWDGFIIQNGSNMPTTSGGGVYLNNNVILRNSIIQNNTSQKWGGGVYTHETGCLLTNCTIQNNESYEHGGGVASFLSVSVEHCIIKSNQSTIGMGGGMILYQEGYVDSCQILENTADNFGGGIFAYNSSIVKNSIIAGNNTHSNIQDKGGGIYAFSSSVFSCNIHNNSAIGVNESRGGGVYLNDHAALINSIVANNTSYGSGGGIYIEGNSQVINSTVVHNKTTQNVSDQGGGIYNDGGDSSQIINTIVWHNVNLNDNINSVSNIRLNYANILMHVLISNCAVENGYYGTDNIVLDNENRTVFGPHFNLPSNYYGSRNNYQSYNANWNIDSVSVCVDLGNADTAGLHLPSFDIEGNARFQGERIDIGAYETSGLHVRPNIHPSADSILYVSEIASGLEDGSSWGNAMSDIQTALDYFENYNYESIGQIWVSAGTYYGDGEPSNSAFYIRDGVKVYGGFAGNEAVSANSDSDVRSILSNRNFEENPTILDGYNSQRVIYQLTLHRTDVTSIWDGFTIQNGYLTGTSNGAGVHIKDGAIFRNCLFFNNYCNNNGGALCMLGNSTIENCRFLGNETINKGGGIYTQGGIIKNCTFFGNKSSSSGGAVYLQDSGIIVNCTIHNNIAGEDGGGVYVNNGGIVKNCLISNNNSSNVGGGGVRLKRGGTLISNTIVNNYSNVNSQGAGVLSESGTITSCLIWGNRRGTIPNQVNIIENDQLPISIYNYCAVEGGCIGHGNIFLSNANNGNNVNHPIFIQPLTIIGNTDSIGNWNLGDSSICINRGMLDTTGLYLPTTDLLGNNRIQNDTMDIGAFESPYFSIPIPTISESGIIYVKEGGAGNMDGSSWANAFATIQDALNIISSDDSIMIWVAMGTYYSTSETILYTDSSFPDITYNINGISMLPGVEIYGGLTGTEPIDYDLSQRDIANNASIIDGQNMSRILLQSTPYPVNKRSIIDGFILQNGNSAYAGGAAYLQANGVIKNCLIRNNHSNFGGGVYIYGGGNLQNCTICHNTAQNGGGIYINYQDFFYPQRDSFFNCVIYKNRATSLGGGIFHHSYNFISERLFMCNMTIVKNHCEVEAGGIFSGTGYDLFNSIVWGNTNTNGENQMHWIDTSSFTLNYCAIEDSLPTLFSSNIMLSSENDGIMPNVNYPRFYNLYSDDYSLFETSCCFNTGQNDYIFTNTDCHGNNRIMYDIVDRGAFEIIDTSRCSPIYQLKVDSQENVNVYISWRTEGIHFRYEIFCTNISTGETFSTPSIVNHHVLTGLVPNTEYEVTVRGKCFEEEGPPYTNFSIPIRFTTSCDTVPFKSVEDTTYCFGPSGMMWRGKSLIDYQIGYYTLADSFHTVCGADSVYILNLTVVGTPELPQTETAVSQCQEESITLSAIPGAWGNTCHWYDALLTPILSAQNNEFTPPILQPGTSKNYWVSSYNDTTGCESERLMVTVTGKAMYDETIDIWSCDSLYWIDTLITSNGTYTKLLNSKYGCDSIVTLNVGISESPTLSYIGDTPILEACVNEPITPFVFTFGRSADSLIFTNLPIGLSVEFNNDTVTVSGTPTVIDQFECTVSTVGQEDPCEAFSMSRVFTVFNCDVPLYGNQNICINNIESYTTLSDQTDYLWNVVGGAILSGQNTDSITVQWNTVGTGSITISFSGILNPITYTINVYNNESSAWETVSCDMFQWNDSVYHESGVYEQVLESINGCDSTVTLTLTINQSNSNTIDITECDSYVWNGTTYSESGQYEQILTNANGCDSTVTLNLTIYYHSDTAFHDTICLGDPYMGYGFDTIPETSGLIQCQRIESNMFGCDSIVTLNLEVHPSYFIEENENIYGESFSWHGSILTEPGTYWDSLSTVQSCDSIFKLNLLIVVFVADSQEQTICEGETILWHNQSLTTSGTYRDTIHVAPAFDSIYILELTVNPSYNFETIDYICAGDSVLFLDSIYVTEEGTYENSNLTSFGCDSNYILQLYINEVITPIIEGPAVTCYNTEITLSVNTGQAFIWNTGQTTQEIVVAPIATTIYSVIVVDSNGCISTAEKEVTVYPRLLPNITGNALLCVGESTTLSVVDGGVTYLWSTGETTSSITVQPTATTTYSVTTTDVYGCSAVAEIQVEVTVPVTPSEVTAIKFSGHIMVVWMGSSETFQLFRNDGFSTYVSDNMYEDYDIEWDQEYCYNISSYVTETCYSSLSSTSCQSIPSICEPPENFNYSLENLDGIKWVHLTWDAAENSNYYIIKCNDEFLTQTNGNFYNDTVVSFENIAKCYTIASHCYNENTSSFSDPICINDLSIADNSDNMSRIYPNPANRQITIEGENIDQISIYNVLGQLIKTQSFHQDNKISIDTEKFESGLYFLKIITQSGVVESRRIMIIH